MHTEYSDTIVAVTMAEARVSKKVSTALDVLSRVADDTDPSRWTA
ncbi:MULTISPECIES: hypothetical protein [Brevibacterium]|nr:MULTISPECIES: hypothetical protein [Brevibacterium]